jgi:hypothetical protein
MAKFPLPPKKCYLGTKKPAYDVATCRFLKFSRRVP